MLGQENPDAEHALEEIAAQSEVLERRKHTKSSCSYVDDAEAHCASARAPAARASWRSPRLHDYGDDYWSDRSYGALDPEGHLWWITQRLRSPAAA